MRAPEVANTNIVLSEMPPMGVMEELNALCGRGCWRWNDPTTVQKKRSRRDSAGPGLGEGIRASQTPSGVAWATHFDFTKNVAKKDK